jgi:hypothetical protein
MATSKTAPKAKPAAKRAGKGATQQKQAKVLNAWQAWNRRADAIDDLCAKVEGGMTLTALAESLGVETSTVTRWIDADPQRSARARDARQRSAAAFDDMALRGIDEARDPFELARAKEKAHHLRWRSAKMNPREYGDKLDVTAEVSLKNLSEEQVKAEAFALAKKLGLTLPGSA